MRLTTAILAGVFLAAPFAAIAKSRAKAPSKTEEKPDAKPAEQTLSREDREALAKLQAMDIFPDMEKEDSEFAIAVSVEVERLRAENPAYFKSPAWPLHVARKVAARYSVKPLTVAEIRRHVAAAFGVDAETFRKVHGIRLVSASLSNGDEVLDVTPQLAGRVTREGFTVDCDGSLRAMLADVSQYEKAAGESDAVYWTRQRKLLAAVGNAKMGQEKLEIRFEFHSETTTATMKSGERLNISEDGKVSVSQIAPAAHAVRATDAEDAPPKPVRKPVKK